MSSNTAPPLASGAARPAYHHGALREALIAATEILLAERGPEGFSLREVARRSGVSAAAPAHHFGDRDGLLTAVATLAFESLQAELDAGRQRGGDDPVNRLREQGVGYVRFALRYPGRFKLMFTKGLRQDAALAAAASAAYGALEDSVRLLLQVAAGVPLDAAQRQIFWSIWSVVHGFAHLALAGQFDAATQGDVSSSPENTLQKVHPQQNQKQLLEVLPGILETQLSAWAPSRRLPSITAKTKKGKHSRSG